MVKIGSRADRVVAVSTIFGGVVPAAGDGGVGPACAGDWDCDQTYNPKPSAF